MALTYTVDDIQPLGFDEVSGKLVEWTRITFITEPSKLHGQVTLECAKPTPDEVSAAIMPEVARLEAIKAL